MKTAVLCTLIAGAAAFAPSKEASSSTALNADLTKEIGALPPLGLFDPLGVLGDAANGDQEHFDRLRWVELKHGRISMLAVVGYLTTAAGIRFPGAEDIPGGFSALEAVPGMVWAQFVATTAMMEMANQDQFQAPWGVGAGTAEGKAEFKGDFRNGFIDFGWDSQSDAWKRSKRTIELNNGRAAMMGITGIMVHESLGNLGAIGLPSP